MVYKPNSKPLKELPKDLLPREKMLKLGSENLSEEELWAIVLGSGTKGFSVLDIAAKLTEIGFEKLSSLSVEELSKIPGVGKVKALTIKAVLELCNRNKNGEKPKITSPKQVEELIRPLIKVNKEHLFVLTLSLAQKLLGIDLIAVGSLNIVYAPLREIFQPVISKNGYFFILVHNHPQGDCYPSPEDKDFTDRVSKGAKLLDLELLDHVIIGEGGYFSFRENGLL
jgi:DNA repair protein RadC